MDIFKTNRRSHMDFNEVYFWTATIYQWKNLLKHDKYKQIIIESLSTLHQRNCINVYGFTIMPNHIHLLWEMLKKNGKENPQGSFLKYHAHSIQEDLRLNHKDVLNLFYVNERDRQYRFWQRDPKAILVDNRKDAEQILDYIHLNPLQEKWNLVTTPEDYHYSSSGFYMNENSNFNFLTHYMDRF